MRKRGCQNLGILFFCTIFLKMLCYGLFFFAISSKIGKRHLRIIRWIGKQREGVFMIPLWIWIIAVLLVVGIAVAVLLSSYENKVNELTGEIVGSRDENAEFKELVQEKINKLENEINTLKKNYELMNNSNLTVFDANNVIQDLTIDVADTEITYTATQNCAINYQYYFKLADGGTGVCSVDDVEIAPTYTSQGYGYFSSRGIVYMKAGSTFKMKSIKYNGSYTVYGLK